MAHKKAPYNRILVVDDIAIHREALFSLLTKEKFIVTLAESGKEALAFMEAEQFDLVLLDVEMPEMNGFEVCQVMRNDIHLKDIPVIFVTSYGKIENKLSGFGTGAQDFITKPYNERELLVRIKTHLLLKHKSDVIRNMNADLELKNKNITQSIEYAKYILHALMPSAKSLDKLIPEKFIYYKSKELIGGDFYWFKQCGHQLYMAIADCTGHGVPGALMSVLGISLLNEVMTDHAYFYSPNEILNKLRVKVIKALNKKTGPLYNNDGMDIAMCLIDFENMKLQFSGANIPFFLMRKDAARNTYELLKRNPDRMPIGNYPDTKTSFVNHYIDLHEDDRIYLFTDGYASQFGGEYEKTYKSRRLIELIKQIQAYDMKKQKAVLEDSFTKWKRDNFQVDDVLVVGLHLNKMRSPSSIKKD
jgi:phosphoserine phosphatase RsbU/P